MKKAYCYFRGVIALIVGILSLLAFVGLLYLVKIFDIQLMALLERLLVDFSIGMALLLAGILFMTFIFGRVYCSTLCPFGLLQELLQLLFRRKRKPAGRNYVYKYYIAVVVFGSLLGGTTCLARELDPYSLFRSAVSGTFCGLAAMLLIAVIVWFYGRFFCSNICPVGAVLGCISKYAVYQIYMDEKSCVSCGACAAKCPTGSIDFKNKVVDNETCVKCFKCVNRCPLNSMRYGIKPTAEESFSPSRRRFLVGGAVAVAVLAVRGGMALGKMVAEKVKSVILPAGAGNAEDFANRCLNCNLCVQNCPMKIIKKADADYPTVHLDYSERFCDYNCNRCSSVCPSGAIRRLSLPEKQRTQIGLAHIDENICIKCGLCVMKCPRDAITKEYGRFSHVHTEQCIGCGTCANGCPVKAIEISAVNQQKRL